MIFEFQKIWYDLKNPLYMGVFTFFLKIGLKKRNQKLLEYFFDLIQILQIL